MPRPKSSPSPSTASAVDLSKAKVKGLCFLSYLEAAAKVSFSQATLYRRVVDGTFPAPVPIAKHEDGSTARAAFLSIDVDRWIRRKVAEAREQARRVAAQAQAVPQGGAEAAK